MDSGSASDLRDLARRLAHRRNSNMLTSVLALFVSPVGLRQGAAIQGFLVVACSARSAAPRAGNLARHQSDLREESGDYACTTCTMWSPRRDTVRYRPTARRASSGPASPTHR